MSPRQQRQQRQQRQLAEPRTTPATRREMWCSHLAAQHCESYVSSAAAGLLEPRTLHVAREGQ